MKSRIVLPDNAKFSQEPDGKFQKLWMLVNLKKKLIKYNYYEENMKVFIQDLADIMELLSSDILKSIGKSVVNCELGYDKKNDAECVIIDSFLENKYQENKSFSLDLERTKFYEIGDIESDINIIFDKFSNLEDITESNLNVLKDGYIDLLMSDIFVANSDRHIGNIIVIYDRTERDKDKIYKLPPSFDNGLAFRGYDPYGNHRPERIALATKNIKINDILSFIEKNYPLIYDKNMQQFNRFYEEDALNVLNEYSEYLNDDHIDYIYNYFEKINDRYIDKNIRR